MNALASNNNYSRADGARASPGNFISQPLLAFLLWVQRNLLRCLLLASVALALPAVAGTTVNFPFNSGSNGAIVPGTPVTTSWTESGYTLNMSITGAPSGEIYGAPSGFVTLPGGGDWTATNASAVTTISVTISIAGGYVFDLNSLDLAEAVTHTIPSNYTITTSKGGSGSGIVPINTGLNEYTTFPAPATSPFTGITSFTISVTANDSQSSISFSNLILNNITPVSPPTISNISPTSGGAGGGNSVVITGTNFTAVQEANGVQFGGTNASYTVNSATQITATTPSHAAGAVDVVINSPGGTVTSAGGFTYIPIPAVTSVSPNSGPLSGGNSITINGSNFNGATAVKFGATSGTITANTGTAITATVPTHAAGQVDITVTTPGGTSSTVGGDHYTYVAAPAITSVSPNSGPIAGGNSININGTDFAGATAVHFGATAGTITANTGTVITATVPNGVTAGTVNITVDAPGGSSSIVLADQYSYVTAPSISSVSPASGNSAGGNSITINGTDFAGATAVHFGATAGTITSNTGTVITATAPAHAAGQIDVTVTTPGGTSATGINDKYTYYDAPGFTAIWPTSGPTSGGTTVTISGNDLAGATSVTIGGAAATLGVINANSITATTPAGSAGAANVVITTPGGTATGVNAFTYVAPPTVTSISPSSGPTGGTTSVTIHGTNFLNATAVSFGATAASSYTVNSATQITATAPTGAAGTAHITVTTAGGTSATSSFDQYTYVGLPTITSISPNSGSDAGGTSVTITGTNLLNASAVNFGGNAATSFTVNSSTEIVAVAPAGAAGSVHITATTAGGTSTTSAADQFTYVLAPAVSSVSPNAGPISGGTSVTITGSNFTGASAVKFGSSNAASFMANSSTQITATSPTGLAGTVDITVVTGVGTSATAPSDQFTYVAAPTITGVSPSSGPTAGSTSVTITGTGFSGATAVKFGSSNATSFTIVSSTQITATLPAGSAGTVDITVTAVGGTNVTGPSDQFTYVPAPAVTGISPSNGPLAGGTSVTITGTNLSGATSVKFGATAASITSNTATQIVATSPAGGAGNVDVTVTTAGGTSTTSLSDEFTYIAAPTVSNLSTTNGPLAGGTSVVITGTGFIAGSTVKFGTTTASSITIDSTTQITATAPAHVAGLVDVTVTSVGGTSTTSGSDQFTYVSGPTVSSISPTSGAAAGGTSVIITGSNFVGVSGATAVKFSASNATSYNVDSATQITAVSPAGSGTVDITVVAAGGTSATGSGDRFTYVAAPTITGITPTSGPAAGGTSVTISGTNLSNASSVTIGGVAATGITVVSATSITATTPAHAAGVVDVVVTTPGGSATGTGIFTYIAGPTVSSLSSNSGSITGGGSIIITGTNLTGATAVKFGTTAVASFTVDSGTQITTTVPAHAAGAVNVTVTTPGGTSPAAPGNQYTYIPPVPVAGNVSLTVERNSSNNVVPLNLTGGTPTSVATPGSPSHGTANISGITITYTPTPGYSGTDSFTYTATNAGGTSGVGTVNITVNARPDPAKDVEVQGVIKAQVDTSVRFAQTQIGNFQSRLEGLHGRFKPAGEGSEASNGNEESSNLNARIPTRGIATSNPLARRQAALAANNQSALNAAADTNSPACLKKSDCAPAVSSNPLTRDLASFVVNTAQAAKNGGAWPWSRLNLASQSNDPFNNGLEIWTAGTINIGHQSNTDANFTTSGISIGSDYRVSDHLILGLGGGFGHERQTIGDNGTRQTGDGYSMAVYGSYQAASNIFFDGLLGYSQLDYDGQRYITNVGGFADAKRKGDQWFASLNGAYEYRINGLLLSPYGRLDLVSTQLKRSEESGAGVYNLVYFDQRYNSSKLSLGMRAEKRYAIEGGEAQPYLRMEYQREFANPGVATLAYADTVSTLYRYDMAESARNTMVVGLGSNFVYRNNWSWALNYRFSHSATTDMHSFNLNLRKSF